MCNRCDTGGAVRAHSGKTTGVVRAEARRGRVRRPDSFVCFHILVALRRELGIKLHVAHLDHRCAAPNPRPTPGMSLALPGGFMCRLHRFPDVTAYRAKHHGSLEEAAREVALSVSGRGRPVRSADSVGCGTHLGSTPRRDRPDASGSRQRHQGAGRTEGRLRVALVRVSVNVIRPLLELTREQTRTLLPPSPAGPPARYLDLSLSPLRTVSVQQLLPLLKNYNPRIVEACSGRRRLAADDMAFIDAEVAGLRGRVSAKEGDTFILNKKGFTALPITLKRHLLRSFIEELLGSLKRYRGRSMSKS